MSKLKVVCIGGYGHLGNPMDQLIGSEDAEFVAFAPAYQGENLDKIVNHEVCDQKARAFDSRDEMLKAVRPDVAIVSTRLDCISASAIAAARAGANVICEKPMAISHSGLADLHQTVKASNVRLIGMFNMRSHGAFVAAREAYQAGDIGELVLFNARKSYRWGKRPDWYDKREVYGGTIPWIGIHAFDMIHYITGEEFSCVGAMQSNLAHPERASCEDNCAIMVEMTNGAHGTISVDFCRPQAAPTHGNDWIRLVGTRGQIEAYGTLGSCQMISEEKGVVDLPVAEKLEIYAPFYASLAGKGDYDIQAPSDPFIITQASLCARDAGDSGQIVKIERGIWK